MMKISAGNLKNMTPHPNLCIRHTGVELLQRDSYALFGVLHIYKFSIKDPNCALGNLSN